MGECYLGLGEPDRALALVNEGLEIVHGRGQSLGEAFGSVILARVLLSSAGASTSDEAEAALARALELVTDTDAKSFEPMARVELAELRRQRGDEEARQQELREAHRLFTEIGASGYADRLEGDLVTSAS